MCTTHPATAPQRESHCPAVGMRRRTWNTEILCTPSKGSCGTEIAFIMHEPKDTRRRRPLEVGLKAQRGYISYICVVGVEGGWVWATSDEEKQCQQAGHLDPATLLSIICNNQVQSDEV